MPDVSVGRRVQSPVRATPRVRLRVLVLPRVIGGRQSAAGGVSALARLGGGIGAPWPRHFLVRQGTPRDPATTSIALHQRTVGTGEEGQLRRKRNGNAGRTEVNALTNNGNAAAHLFDFGLVAVSFNYPSRTRAIAPDWPSDSHFSMQPGNRPAGPVTQRGRRYFQNRFYRSWLFQPLQWLYGAWIY